MRVLIVTDWMAAPGGAEAYVGWVRSGLADAGHEVRLLTSSVGSRADGTADFVARGSDRLLAQVGLQVVNPFAVATVRRAVREMMPDVAYAIMFANHLSPAALLALGHVPLVLGVHDYKIVCPEWTKLLPDGVACGQRAGVVCWRSGCLSLARFAREQPRYALVRAVVRRAARVLACSSHVQAELTANGIASEHLPLPVPGPRPGFRRTPAPEPLFVYCGRLRQEKGVTLLLEAIARLRTDVPSATLRVVGDGEQRAELERLARRPALSGAVTFTGWLSRDGVERALADAWALVAPSLWAEPLGFVALEAIVRGVPVIASLNGGFAETVEPGISGLLFPNGDADALLRCLRAAASGSAFPGRSVKVEVAARTARERDLGLHLSRLCAVFSSVVRAEPGRALDTA